jgi:hypothetical protein
MEKAIICKRDGIVKTIACQVSAFPKTKRAFNMTLSWFPSFASSKLFINPFTHRTYNQMYIISVASDLVVFAIDFASASPNPVIDTLENLRIQMDQVPNIFKLCLLVHDPVPEVRWMSILRGLRYVTFIEPPPM